MAIRLSVYLHDVTVGILTQDEYGRLTFQYSPSYREKPAARPLSYSLPLQREAFSYEECGGFFNGVLPEAANRETIARNLQITARNDLKLLERIGGECAGAITFLPEGEGFPAPGYRYHPLTPEELAEILRTLPVDPERDRGSGG